MGKNKSSIDNNSLWHYERFGATSIIANILMSDGVFVVIDKILGAEQLASIKYDPTISVGDSKTIFETNNVQIEAHSSVITHKGKTPIELTLNSETGKVDNISFCNVFTIGSDGSLAVKATTPMTGGGIYSVGIDRWGNSTFDVSLSIGDSEYGTTFHFNFEMMGEALYQMTHSAEGVPLIIPVPVVIPGGPIPIYFH